VKYIARFEVMAAVAMKFQDFWDKTKPRRFINSLRRFGGECL